MTPPPSEDRHHLTGASPPPQTSATVDEAPAHPPATVDEVAPDAAPPGEGVPPAVLGRFVLGGEIGRGGMGAVLRGRDPLLHRDLAIKVLRADRRDDPHVVGRFLAEARIAGQLEHPGVPPVHDLGQTADGRPYFTMKLIRGRTLAELLRERSDDRSG